MRAMRDFWDDDSNRKTMGKNENLADLDRMWAYTQRSDVEHKLEIN